MRRLPALEPWQKSLMEHWEIQAAIDGGCVDVDLDGFLSEPLASRILVVAVEEIADFEQTRRASYVGELFVELLEGKVKTIASSPIDYL